jgi:leucyl aminopeptidase
MPVPLILTPTDTPLLESDCDAVLLPVLREELERGNFPAADAALDGVLAEMLRDGECCKKAGQVEIIPTLGRLPARRLALVGLGKREDCTPLVFRRAIAAAARVLGRRKLAVAAADAADAPFPPEVAAVALADGAEMARYHAGLYKTADTDRGDLAELRVGGAPPAALREGGVRGRARNLARVLIQEPGNRVDPPELARRAREMAAETGLECEVLGEVEMENLGMGGILAVTRGTETPAQFIVLRHHPRGDGPLLALIGKAVTFDTGGISLKPVTDMGRMKADMAGGAAVIGAMRAIAELDVPLRVLGLVPAAENLPDGRAWKPGDVIPMMSGKTVETITTDAEGRMLLADALCYARQLGATHLVDIATLTGACAVALGNAASGLYGNDDDLVRAVRECGEEAGERHWPMPYFPEYREQIRSDVADLKNSGGRLGGSVTAAAFLREFVEDVPWAHLDIAGSAHDDKARPWAPAGPTGTGVGTFLNLARRLAEQG